MNRSRRLMQAFFLVLTAAGVMLVGARCELWCPMGGVEALKAYWNEGAMVCSLGVSNFFILGGVLGMALLARRAFCGYVCPIGALSELCRWIGGRLGLKRREVPARLDAVLGLLKYAVLAAVLWGTWQLGELVFRGYCPAYALISRQWDRHYRLGLRGAGGPADRFAGRFDAVLPLVLPVGGGFQSPVAVRSAAHPAPGRFMQRLRPMPAGLPDGDLGRSAQPGDRLALPALPGMRSGLSPPRAGRAAFVPTG